MDKEVHHICERYHAAIELIGARWSGAILRAIFTERHRYAQIKAAVPGLSDTMLAERLRRLELEGLVERRVVPSTPVQVEYHLTRKGADLEEVMQAVVTWSHRWLPVPGQPADDALEAAPRKAGVGASRSAEG
jgi:DNA-binding HxlR family transcriptional regulator